MATFGNLTVLRNTMTPEQHRQFLQEMADRLPTVVATIDAHVSAIVAIVRAHDPLTLLQSGYFSHVSPQLFREPGKRESPDDTIAQRMVDYVQSIIACVPRDAGPLPPITPEAWAQLHTHVKGLFDTLNGDYIFSCTAEWHLHGTGLPDDRHEFFVRAHLMWCNVTGHRYHHQEIAYLRELMTPHSGVLQRLWGIDADGLADGLGRVLHALSRGLGESLQRLHGAYQDYVAQTKAAGAAAEPRIMAESMAHMEKDPAMRHAGDSLFGTALFKIDGCLPPSLLRDLSWAPGECRDFLDGKDRSGWPTRVWPRTLRPFVFLDGCCYCFDVHALFDNIYRVLQRTILSHEPGYRHAWDDAQKSVSEALPLRLFKKLLPAATTRSSIFYQTRELDGLGQRKWCELDGLVTADDHLFIVEVKAGVFKLAPPETDFDAYVRSIERLIFNPADQGERFLRWLNDEGRIDLFDAEHQKVGELRREDFKHVTICALSLDPFTELSAKSHHLRSLVGRSGNVPFWALSLGDLQTYSELFDNPLTFLHYVEKRGQAIGSEQLILDDEFDHYGMYLKHNNYDLHAAKVGGEGRISWSGYRAVVDGYFDRRIQGESVSLPRQQMPALFTSMIDLLARGSHPSRRRVASLLLDFGGREKDNAAAMFVRTQEEQKSARRAKPFSIHGSHARITFYCWQDGVVTRSAASAARHTKTVMLGAAEPERLLLELFLDAQGNLIRLEPTYFSDDSISAVERAELVADAHELTRKRHRQMTTVRGKVGRNEQCPCGSGKKFKRCCLDTLS